MTDKPKKTPGPDHPIAISHTGGRVIVRAGGQVVADTKHALTLQEASYPAVQYVPREDTKMLLLNRTDHAKYCPYKGDCSYYSIESGGARATNAVWTYEAPFPAVAAIRDHLAFYPDRIDSIEILPA
jgi:uncharacterized protein (DUF427 family)